MTNWKDVAIGSASTLAVTVLSGVVIYYATREPPATPPGERLVYEVQMAGEFDSPTTKTTLQTVRVGNLGDATAADVRVVVEYPPSIEIVDKTVAMSSGPAGSYSVLASLPQRVEISVPTLVPSENLTLSVVLRGSLDRPAAVAVKSTKTVASAGGLIPEPVQDRHMVGRDVAMWLLPLLIIAQVPLALLFSRRFISMVRGIRGYERSRNNTAFILLHQGLTDRAASMFAESVARGDADGAVLSNLALCQLIRGESDEASRSADAADFFDKTNRHASVIRFNKALMALLNGDELEAIEQLQLALKADRAEVTRWCHFSRIFQEHSKARERVVALLKA